MCDHCFYWKKNTGMHLLAMSPHALILQHEQGAEMPSWHKLLQ